MRTTSLIEWMKNSRPELDSKLVTRIELCRELIAEEKTVKSAHDIRIVGSTARGWFSDGSDVDLMVLADEYQRDLTFSSNNLEVGISFIQTDDVAKFLEMQTCNASELRLAANLEVGLVLKRSRKFTKRLTSANSQKVPDQRLLAWYLGKSDIWLSALENTEEDIDFSLLSSKILQTYIFVALLSSPTRLLKHKWNLISLRFEIPELYFIVVMCYDLISPEDPEVSLVETFRECQRFELVDSFQERLFREALFDSADVKREYWLPEKTAAYLLNISLFSILDSVSAGDSKIAISDLSPKLPNGPRGDVKSLLLEARRIAISQAINGYCL